MTAAGAVMALLWGFPLVCCKHTEYACPLGWYDCLCWLYQLLPRTVCSCPLLLRPVLAIQGLDAVNIFLHVRLQALCMTLIVHVFIHCILHSNDTYIPVPW